MIKIPITNKHLIATLEMAEQKEFNRSMRGEEANLIGTLGEIVVYQYLNENQIKTDFDLQYTHDLIVENQITADVKTKERTVAPKPFYDCTIPEYNHHIQRPEIFVFTSLTASKKYDDIRRFHTAYILGYITLKRLEKIATYWTPEMTDKRNNWTPTIPCYNIEIKDLQPLIKDET